ncbi:hypothetical protein AB1Y20_000254 [Prymnesium parvum]|uniref:RING-type E3 ubiquitin transferase n=1 Tax=Prymnesium parvum TaxID=97485 RepID=A0AB34K9K6_PRYPA
MPQLSYAVSLAQHYKRLHEEAVSRLRDEVRQHKECAIALAALRQQQVDALRDVQQQSQAMRELQLTAVAASEFCHSESECHSRILREELRECERGLVSAHMDITGMKTSRRLLVEEVKDLRRMLPAPDSEHLDLEHRLDQAISLLYQKESLVRALEGQVSDLREQLVTHRKALRIGKELSEEARRASAQQEARAEESERYHELELQRLRDEADAAERRATSARELAIKEMAQRELLESMLKDQKKRETLRLEAEQLSALIHSREELRQTLREQSSSLSTEHGKQQRDGKGVARMSKEVATPNSLETPKQRHAREQR